MKLQRLRCEYEVNPIGIDAVFPRLSWELDNTRRGAMQAAYQVLVARALEELAGDRGTLWESGKVASDQSIHVAYAGSKLSSRQRCFWKVRVWDEQGGASDWSEPARWEMGLLERGDWKGKWIASPIVGGPYSIPAVPYLRRDFSVTSAPVSARLYVTALGMYEFEINGKRVGDCVFAPGRTEYHKRVPYHVFDISALVGLGPNCCGALLGDGWYCGHLHSDPRQTYGDRPRLLAQLVIECADGSTQVIRTDASWKTGEGPIRSSDMLMGEDYDARLEIPGWSRAGFHDSGWQPAIEFADPGI
jgi:alpha-L-rhamnosidase